MTVGILTEKPSAARNFAAALGGARGTYNGEDYVIVAARGHLYEFVDPSAMVPADRSEHYRSWNLANLPWDISEMSWARQPQRGVKPTVDTIAKALRACDEIVIATDVDPTGEGQAIAWNILDELNLHGKKVSRMNFTDEAAASLQKAFKARSVLPPMTQDPEYKKADFRTKFDLLTMQFTRIATASAAQQAVLRQGRLKSAMVLLVGEQLKAHNDYKKIPVYQNRFRDENGVLYVNPEEAKYATEAEVPRSYSASPVVVDSKTDKRTAPRRLLDLAALSSRLSGKGVKADQVLAVYQKMYEDQVVSYPRTEDKTITTEQFNELLPHVDKIAAVVGVDTGLLTVRTPRRTHVKDSGAHGANRPGTNVPASLDALANKYGPVARFIYEELARSYLAMLAEDYVYEAQEGHVEKYPDFKGRAAVPKSLGWKQVFKDGDDVDEDESSSGLGTNADPIVYEIIPPRPEHPSMKWLMKQLEKRDVGTGATRTSTYAEVTKAQSKTNKYPLLHESRGKITMTEFGEMSYRLLPGTRIGDLGVTEFVYGKMREIAEGKTTADAELAIVAEWVREDIETMRNNAAGMRKELGLTEQTQQKEKFQGTWSETGEVVKFSREWSGVRFTDQQCQDLLAGKEIEFEATSRAGKPYQAKGKLAAQVFKRDDGKEYPFIGFKPDFGPKTDASGKPVPPSSFLGVSFTDEQLKKLADGEKVYAEGFTSKKGNKFDATVSFGPNPKRGNQVGMIFHFDD